MHRGFVIGAAAVAACTFAPREVVPLDAPASMHDVAIDTPSERMIDAAMCPDASVTCSDPSTLRTCAAAGSAPVLTTCSWGCTGATAHCAQLQPAGSAVLASDVAPGSGLLPIALSGALIINSDTGEIGLSGDLSSVRGSGSGIVAGIDFEQRGADSVGMFRFASLTVSDPVVIVGSNAVAFVADGDMSIDALVDVRGFCGTTTPVRVARPAARRGTTAWPP